MSILNAESKGYWYQELSNEEILNKVIELFEGNFMRMDFQNNRVFLYFSLFSEQLHVKCYHNRSEIEVSGLNILTVYDKDHADLFVRLDNCYKTKEECRMNNVVKGIFEEGPSEADFHFRSAYINKGYKE